MNVPDLLAGRIAALRQVVARSFDQASGQSQGFALRILGVCESLPGGGSTNAFNLDAAADSAPYGGVPVAAYLGFGIGSRQDVPTSAGEAFSRSLERLRNRVGDRLDAFLADDLAVLGVADGVAVLGGTSQIASEFGRWLSTLIHQQGSARFWSERIRALAADLVDERERLRSQVPASDLEALALELCLRRTWPHAFRNTPVPEREVQQTLMQGLLTEPAPKVGDLERAVVWLCALNLLVEQAAMAVVPSVSETVSILRRTQAALKRWVWEENPRRRGAASGRWLIDNEYHVQSFLWSVLYPILGDELQDETYLTGFGLVQPRADLVVVNQKLIIEVKILRQPADFKGIEEQIAGDLGLYFSQPERFNRLIAYIYDDCDHHQPQLYDILRTALVRRDQRVEDVVIIRRPGMIPPRANRTT